jgi:hypothetical protein
MELISSPYEDKQEISMFIETSGNALVHSASADLKYSCTAWLVGPKIWLLAKQGTGTHLPMLFESSQVWPGCFLP